jgi:hypothetical protein
MTVEQTVSMVPEIVEEAIPADLAAFEEVELALKDLDPNRNAPRFILQDDADAETLMARIKALRLEATKAAGPIDAEIAERRAHIEALKKAMARLEADVQYLLDERQGAVMVYYQAEDLYRPSLETYLLSKIDANPKGEKGLVLQSGKLLSVQPPAKWAYDDKALAAWADANLPSVVKKEPVVNKAELKKLVKVDGGLAIHPETGAPVPGITITTPPREITLEVTL